MSILEVKINQFKYKNSKEIILKNLSLSVEPGELIVITGLSGCGKTTLTRILNGLIPNHYEGDLDGEVKLFDKNLLDYEKGELAKYIGNVFQNPSDQFFATIAEEEVAFVGENLGMPLEELKQKTKEAFEKMEISDLMDKKLSELSGGQKQRISLARALYRDPEILILDDSFSAIDANTESKIVNSLKENRKNRTNIIISHRISAVEHSDLILVMDNGEIIDRGTHEELISRDSWYKEQFEYQSLDKEEEDEK